MPAGSISGTRLGQTGVEDVRRQLAQTLNADNAQLLAQLQDNTEKTGEPARACKLDAVHLPLRENRNKVLEASPQRGNSNLQLQILRDLTSRFLGPVDICAVSAIHA